MHRDRFLVQILCPYTSGESLCSATSLGIKLGRSFHVRKQAFRTASCVIRLTMLQHNTTFVCRTREEVCMHEAPRKSERIVYHWSNYVSDPYTGTIS